jgi:hypothetical protein
MQPLPTAKRICREDVFGRGLKWKKVRYARALKRAASRLVFNRGERGAPFRKHLWAYKTVLAILRRIEQEKIEEAMAKLSTANDFPKKAR